MGIGRGRPTLHFWRSCVKQSDEVIRIAQGGGRWFSGDRAELVREVEGYIAAAEIEPLTNPVIGVIAPHAGYLYSGAVAGYSFRALRESAAQFGAPETVVILGLSHSAGFAGAALMDGDAISTPIRESALDVDGARLMSGMSDRIYFDYEPHIGEHSAENQIPFVQAALPEAKLIVGLIGDHADETRAELASALHKLSQHKPIAVVASTDLLHSASYELVGATDKKTMAMIAGLDEAGLTGGWSFEHQVCCGISPVVTLMKYVRMCGVESGTVLRYRNSGDDYPESRGSWVVGYGAVSF